MILLALIVFLTGSHVFCKPLQEVSIVQLVMMHIKMHPRKIYVRYDDELISSYRFQRMQLQLEAKEQVNIYHIYQNTDFTFRQYHKVVTGR